MGLTSRDGTPFAPLRPGKSTVSMNAKNDSIAVVLGLFETGLGVGRSLGRSGISVLGLDASKKLGFYSRYIKASLCPDPLDRESEFISLLLDIGARQQHKPVLFITSDDFLNSVSKNRALLEEHYRLNLPAHHIVESTTDKFKQHHLAAQAGIPVPTTFVADDMEQVQRISDEIPLPAFIKGREASAWRRRMGVDRKGFVVKTREELLAAFRLIFECGATGLIQEIIPGPDTSHFKASCYISQSGDVLLAFGLQKIRQQPKGFGFGCLVQSVHYLELLEIGTRFLKAIGYRGVGSAEFKYDRRDGKFKLIELNPRYWQQNALAEKCGMNFPLIHYLDLTGQEPKALSGYREGIKWVNLYSDLQSFRDYQRELGLPLTDWFRSLKGPRMYSDHAWDDVLPGLYATAFGYVLPSAWKLVSRPVRRRRSSAPVLVHARRSP